MKTLKILIVVAGLLSTQGPAIRNLAADDQHGPGAGDDGATPRPAQVPGFHGFANADTPPEPGIGDDLKILQGSWELLHGNEGKGAPTLRSVKTIVGNLETLRRYSLATGEMLSERMTEFELNQSGPVRVFTFHPVGAEPKSGFSYVYKVNNREFHDVTGLLHGTEYRDYSDTPTIWRWTRVIERAGDGAANPGTVNSDTRTASPRDQESQGLVLIKNVTLTNIDEARGVISGTIRDEDRAAQIENIRLAAGVRLVGSHVIPTVNNHMPFEWQNLMRLKGKVVSIRVRASDVGISVVSISERND